MNLAWLHQGLRHDVQSKSSIATRPRKSLLHLASGTSWSQFSSSGNHFRPLINSSSSWEMNILSHRNRSSSSSSSLSSSFSSSNHSSAPLPNTSFMRKAHVLGDLMRHSTKVYSLTTVAIIAGIFVMVTVATAVIVALFWCKRNSVFAFKGSDSEELEECEMDELDTDVDDGEEPLCRTSATEEEEEEEEEEDDEEECEEADEPDEDGCDAAHNSSGLSILSCSESPRQTRTCFPRAARTKEALRDRSSIFRGLKSFRFRSTDLVASVVKANRLLYPSSLVSLLDRRRGQTSTFDHVHDLHRSEDAAVYSPMDEMTSQLVRDCDVSSDDDLEAEENGDDDKASSFKAPASPLRRHMSAGYRRLAGMATVGDETAAVVGEDKHLREVLFSSEKIPGGIQPRNSVAGIRII